MISRIQGKNLFIGDANDIASITSLCDCGIDAIVNVTGEVPDYYLEETRHYRVCLIDGPGNELYEYALAAMIVLSLLTDGKRVLLHCLKGKSRSPAIATIVLAANDLLHGVDESIRIAEETIKASREITFIKDVHRPFIRNAVSFLRTGRGI